MRYVDFHWLLAILPGFEAVEYSAVNITRRSFNCKFVEFLSSIFFSELLDFSEAANIPLQQIPYYPPTTQQKGRPRKRKPLQTDETIITNSDGPPEHHLSHDGTLRLGESCENLFIDLCLINDQKGAFRRQKNADESKHQPLNMMFSL